MSKLIAQKLHQDEELTESEEAYLKGFMDASSLNKRNNPYPKDSILAAEYDRGYTASMSEICDY